MANLSFSKWHGAGNDFILVDDRTGTMPVRLKPLARRWCQRHFSIGSDGLILLRPAHRAGTDYHMEFLNPDGSRSFCGNGSRCAFAFHSQLTGNRGPARFTAYDGVHTAKWMGRQVEVSMRDVTGLERISDQVDLVDTGSPHLVVHVEDPAALDLVAEAHRYRYAARFKQKGVNVNFVCWRGDMLEMRTYERGVEAETLSCGTGVTAAALSAMARGHCEGHCRITAPGGRLAVRAERVGEGFAGIHLTGPVQKTFTGNVHL